LTGWIAGRVTFGFGIGLATGGALTTGFGFLAGRGGFMGHFDNGDYGCGVAFLLGIIAWLILIIIGSLIVTILHQ
jgi:hypothetical protein